MKNARIDIGSIRREQIVDAAVAVIAEQGLQNLSLSEIEKRAGMTRGHLTYYFPAKEAILLAVFDRLLQLMCERNRTSERQTAEWAATASMQDVLRMILQVVLREPQANPEFHALQYTFLSQIGHREDFRQRLASLYEEWRSRMSEHLANDFEQGRTRRRVAPRAMASLIQATLHGLAMQLAADPNAFDREQMLDLCLDVVGSYLKVAAPSAPKHKKKATRPATAVNGSPAGRRRPNRP
jgi:AcrR family transcriptional regulator